MTWTGLLLPLAFAEEKEKIPPISPDEIKILSAKSKLQDILVVRNIDRKSINIEDIHKIIVEEKDNLHGKIKDVSNFFTLIDLCEVIKNHPNKKDLSPLLLKEYETAEVLQGEPENWNEILVKSRDGFLGVYIDCYLDISGHEAFRKMFDSAYNKNDTSKMKVILNRIRISDDLENYLKIIEAAIEGAKSDEMKKLLKEFNPS